MKIMKKKILLLLITVFAYSFVGYTQQPYIYIPFDPKPQVQLPASDAQSLGQFGEIPVDLFTGRVNINIPIYTIRYNGMEVPISISYHGGGIKVTDEAGSVGLGWTLNVGGVINRIVRGMPDELFDSSNRVFGHSRLHEPNAQMQNTLGDFRGFIRRIQANSTKYPARNPSVLSSPYTPAELDLALLISQYGPLFDGGHFDTAPDNYIFNVMGLSGAFVYPAGPNSNVKNDDSRILQSNNGVTIHRNNTAGFYSIQDANGFNHLFLDKDAEYQTFFYRVDNINDIRPFDEREHDISFRYRSSWWLSRIVSPANEVITFHYSDVRIVYPAQQFHGFVYSRTRGFGMCQLTDNPLQFPINNTRHTNSRDTVFKKLLSHIETPTSIVRFNYHIPAGHYLNHSPQLESIVVFSRADSINPVEKTTFNYLRRGNARAQLRTLTRHGSNGETQSHRFSYHPGLGELSRLNDERRDHWGFFAPTSRGRFPVLKTLGHPAPPALWNNVNYTNRNADISTAAAGMLAGIVYPTGGSTTLVWEPHTWSRMSRAGDRAQWDRDLGNREIPASNNQSHSLVLRGAKGHEQLHTVPFTTTRPSTIILDFSGYYPPDEIAKLENNPGVPSPGFCLSGWDCNLTAPAVVIYMNNVEIDRIYICRETIQQGLREINMPQSGNLRFRLENPRGGFSALHDQHCKALYERFNMFEHGTPPFGNISIQIHWSEGSSLVPNPTWAVGGVRIQSITNNSGSGALIRRFEYAPDNASHCYGVLAFPVRYGTIIERCHTIIVPGNQDCNNMSGARITDCPQTLILTSTL